MERAIFSQFLHDIRMDSFNHGSFGWVKSLAFSPSIRVCLIYRIEKACAERWLLPIGYILHRLNLNLYGVDILPGANIAGGFQIPHPSGVVIGAGSKIGRNCKVMQGVTIGVKDVSIPAGLGDYPIIGDDVVIGTKSSILGRVTIGSNSVIGAHCLVLHSFPNHSKIVGVPGKLLP